MSRRGRVPALLTTLLAATLAACADPAPGIAVGPANDDEGPSGGRGHGAAADERATRNDAPASAALPRLVAPASGSTATSSRPTFRIAHAAGVNEARLEICRDRACATVEQELHARGSSVRPTDALAPGVHFVRVSARASEADATTAPTATTAPPASTSPVTSLRIRASASSAIDAVDTAWGATPDIDGDGFDDLAITSQPTSTPAPGREPPRVQLRIHRGHASGFSTTPDATIIMSAATPLGPCWVANAGDVNGDGYADLLLGVPGHGANGHVDLHLGSPGGIGPAPQSSLAGATDDHAFATQGRGVGDVDRDGYADVAVLATPGPLANSATRILVLRGGPSGLRRAQDLVVSAAAGTTYAAVLPAGDVDGDGFADLAAHRVPATSSATAPSAVDVFLGSPTGLSPAAALSLTSPDPDDASRRATFGTSIAAADLDGDGYADLAVAESNGTLLSPWRVHVYRGSATGIASVPSATLLAPVYAGTRGPVLAPAGDVNGDGYDDLLVGSPEALVGLPTAQPLLTRAVLYFGGPSGPSTTTFQAFALPAGVTDVSGTFGSSVLGVGDVDRDGHADILVGSAQLFLPSFGPPTAESHLYLHGGSALGAWAVPTTTIASAPSGDTIAWSAAAAF